MFGGIKFRTIRRQQFDTDVGWLDQSFAFVPSGIISKQHNIFLGVSLTQGVQQFIHRSSITLRSDQAIAVSSQRAYGTECIGMLPNDLPLYCSPLPFRYPAAAYITDATKAGFIFKEDLYGLLVNPLPVEKFGCFFLNASTLSLTCAAFGCCGRGAFLVHP